MPISIPPTTQKAGARPISFVLDDRATGNGVEWVQLVIRPEDLTRTEPIRTAVHQTLGREVVGWSDNFGQGLPSISISGNTGWRQHSTYGDGEAEFLRLNDLVAKRFPDLKQRAIDVGRDPALVKLIFVDNLNSSIWSVEPQQFLLRRNKSRALLFQYSITLQALDTRASTPVIDVPFLGNISTGMDALDRAISTLDGFAGNVEGWVNDALRSVSTGWAPIGGSVRAFMGVTDSVFSSVNRIANAVQGGIGGVDAMLTGTARDLAHVGMNVFRTVSNVDAIPQDLMYSVGRVGAAYQEVFCIFKNSLRPRRIYEDYDDMFGASNCSSTTGGDPASPLLGVNAFELMVPGQAPVIMDQNGMGSIKTLSTVDPVTFSMTPAEIDRNLRLINSGFGGVRQ